MFVNLTAAVLVVTIDAENSKILGSSGPVSTGITALA